tara:strand:+ start:903 stop:1802 length:900 start_codon:yes stop_codon:yes gene_type:complete
MATPSPLTKLYAGDEAAGFISASLLSGETLAKGNITLLPNVTFKVNLKAFDMAADSVSDASCDFVDGSAVSYVEKALTPENFKLQKELCKKDWLSTYAGATMRAGVDGTLPANFQEYIVGHAGALVGQQVEKSIWAGSTATSGQFDGFQVLLAADATVVDVAGATLSASNIVAELGKVRDAIKDANYGQEDLAIYVGTGAMKFYVSAQAALGYQDQFHVGVTEANFEGTKLILAPGLEANKMVAARKSNLFFATDLASDMAEVKVIDMTENDGSDNVRLVMKWNAGVGYATGSDIVYYA